MLEAVFFDFGDTLINSSRTLMQVHQEFTWPTFKELGAKGSYDEFKQALNRTMNRLDPPVKPVKLHTFHIDLAKELGLSKFTEEEALSIDTEVWRRHLSIVKLFPHARETLEWLQEKNLKVTLISNVFDEMLNKYIVPLNLPPLFDLIITSEAVGAVKSQLTPFNVALERLKVDASQTIHIGDLPEEDGACRELGIHYVLSTFQLTEEERQKRQFKEEQYDYTVESYLELQDLIRRL